MEVTDLYRLKINLKFSIHVSVLMNNIKYLNLISFKKKYIFHMTVIMINSDCLVKVIFNTLVNINKCLTKKKN